MNKYYIYIILFFEVFILKNIFGKITNNKIILKDEYKKQIDNVSYSIVFDGEIYNKNALRNICITKGYITDNSNIQDLIFKSN